MSWLIWRQHRLAGVSALVMLVAVAIPLVITGLAMRGTYDQLGLAACIGHADGRCSDLLAQFSEQYRGWGQQWLPWLNFVPGLLGALVGAPLVARELEQRTHLLAWTQGVTRRRWLATKLAVLVLAIVILGVAFTVLISWWRWPLDQLEGSFQPNSFDFEGLVPTAYTLFAFALGSFLGVLLRRTVPAMAVMIAAFFVIRYPLIEVLLRPHLQPALQLTLSPADFVKQNILASNGSWVLDSGLQNASGRHVSGDEINQLVRQAFESGVSPPTWFQQHGYLRWMLYEPADRFWTFQAVEAAIFVALAILAMVVTLNLVRRLT